MKTEINDYPIITNILEDGNKEKLNNGFILILEKLNNTIEQNEIVNPEFNDVKYYINRIVDFVFKKAISDKYLYAGKYQSLPEELQFLSVPYELRSVSPFFKKLNKLTEYKNESYVIDAKLLESEFSNLVEGYNFMKEKVIKMTDKRKKEKELTQEKENEWHKNLVSHKDVKLVLNLLNNESKNIHDKLMQSHLKQVLYIIDNFKKKSVADSDYRKWIKNDIFSLIVLQQLTERKGLKTVIEKSIHLY